jgi:hypothetical protein
MLREAVDDMVLGAATNAAATHLVTFKGRDSGTAPARFGIVRAPPNSLVRRSFFRARFKPPKSRHLHGGAYRS